MCVAICPQMNGSMCAADYCDYWDAEEQRCSLALESHKRVELLGMIISRAEELLAKSQDKEDILKVVKKLNIVSVNKTLQ
jgi:hypothetical protein